MPRVLMPKFEESAIPLVITGQALEGSSSRDMLVVLMAVAVVVEEEEEEEAAMVVEAEEAAAEVAEAVARNVLLHFEDLYLLVELHDQPCSSQW